MEQMFIVVQNTTNVSVCLSRQVRNCLRCDTNQDAWGDLLGKWNKRSFYMMEMKGQRWDLHPLWQLCKILPTRVIDAINISVESRSRRRHIIDCIRESNQMFMAVIALLLLGLRHREMQLKRTSASEFSVREPVWHSKEAHQIHEGKDVDYPRQGSQVYDQWAENVCTSEFKRAIQRSLRRITIHPSAIHTLV